MAMSTLSDRRIPVNHDATEQMTQTANAIGERLPAATSYVGAGVSVGSALSLPEVGIVIGIVTALLTFAGNYTDLGVVKNTIDGTTGTILRTLTSVLQANPA